MKSRYGFTLMEVMVGIGIAGVILVILCGVFVYGLNAIEKGRIRSTAINLAERKISEAHNLMKSLREPSGIKGNDLVLIISDCNELTWDSVAVDPNEVYNWPFNKIEAMGTTLIDGTGVYDYTYTIDYYSDDLRRVSVEITWQEEKVGPQKIFLESLVSRFK